MKNQKKTIKLLTIALSIMICLIALMPTSVQAAGKTKLNTTKKTINVGDSCTIKLLNNSKKVKWSVSNKNIKIISKNNKQAKIKGAKKGTAYLKAKVGKKTYQCKVTVKKKDKGNGSKKKPYSAYETYTTDIYGARYYGKAKVKLIEYKDGKEALKYLKNHGLKKNPEKSKEYVYLKFEINYFDGQEEILADLVINPYTCFYSSNSNKQLKWNEIKCNDGVEYATKEEMSPGDKVICKAIFLVESKDKPVTYKINGYDKEWNPTETWFTTKK